MKINTLLGAIVAVATLSGCQPKEKESGTFLVGTWELVSATTTEKDSTFSTFDSSHRMIKIINPTHFAFLNHKLNPPKDSSNEFTGGGGKYTLVDSVYTEHLDYFTDKAWEGNKFQFVVKMSGDTLVQKGVERIEKLGIDHIIIEKYKRVSE
ncbi:hypothetical protein GCM10028807_02110 [Spirosoma daeguense]